MITVVDSDMLSTTILPVDAEIKPLNGHHRIQTSHR